MRSIRGTVLTLALLAVPAVAWSQTTTTSTTGPTTVVTNVLWVCHNPDGSLRGCTREEAEAELRRPTTTTSPPRAEPAPPTKPRSLALTG